MAPGALEDITATGRGEDYQLQAPQQDQRTQAQNNQIADLPNFGQNIIHVSSARGELGAFDGLEVPVKH
jgi:hypothetical protein